MDLVKKYRRLRKAALFMAAVMMLETVLPLAVAASSKGPKSPEFMDFKAITSNELVDPCTGDFSYSIPLMVVPGPNGISHPINLFYRSNVTPEEDAGWVGYGWSLNASGAINRTVRGFPDDQDGQEVQFWNKTRPNWTVTTKGLSNLELFGFNLDFIDLGSSLGSSGAVRFNNHAGFEIVHADNVNMVNVANIGFSQSTSGTREFTWGISPLGFLNKQMFSNAFKANNGATQMGNKLIGKIASANIEVLNGESGKLTYGQSVRPFNSMAYDSESDIVKAQLTGNFAVLQMGISAAVEGLVSCQSPPGSAVPKPVFGLMYNEQPLRETDDSLQAALQSSAVLDYMVENQQSYFPGDEITPIPFANGDVFSATGFGVNGLFKLHNRTGGFYFRPDKTTSTNAVGFAEIDLLTSADLGLGSKIPVANQATSIEEWKPKFATTSMDTDEVKFFRFVNDKGGFIHYDNIALDSILVANMVDEGEVGADYKPLLPGTTGEFGMNEGKRIGRSNYIAYHTNAEMTEEIGGKPYKAYSRKNSLYEDVDRSDTTIAGGIGEFSIFQNGWRYGYGLPVMAKEETSLQVGPVKKDDDIVNNYLVYKPMPTNPQVKMGEINPHPYATSWLLTDITSPDYIDRSDNGLTDDDFGGWINFDYDRAFGADVKSDPDDNDHWFRWRVPYTGFYYHRGKLLDRNDDAMSWKSGLKEIYYLRKVETKTHYAEFITSTREDGLEAFADEFAGDLKQVDFSATHSAPERLDKIRLYAKNEEGDKLLQTVYFDYDYSLAPGQPNSRDGQGKLTLKKVWMAYEDVVEADHSPYQFVYSYPDKSDYAPEVWDRYHDILDPLKISGPGGYMPSHYEAMQNPAWAPENTDAWGYYQYDGASRTQLMQPWVNQAPDAIRFDPAAWHLKRIILPTGGEIQVQYEQKDYRYVQDKPAMAMVSMLESSKGGLDRSICLNQQPDLFLLNLEDIGLDPSDPGYDQQVNALVNNVYEHFDKDAKVYYKILYALAGDDKPSVSHNVCNSEYIDGYSYFSTFGGSTFGFRCFNFDDRDRKNVVIHLPFTRCLNYVETGIGNNIDNEGSCDPALTSLNNVYKPDAGTMFEVLAHIPKAERRHLEITRCTAINYEQSYIRIPVLRKLGGGVKVKRVLTYDHGLEKGDAELYGQEFYYEDEEGQSSGVAVNEPAAIGEENALRQLLYEIVSSNNHSKRNSQNIGETQQPSPSITYGRVAVQNIHRGRTNAGFTIFDYQTLRKYPSSVGTFYTPLEFDPDADRKEHENFKLPLGVLNMDLNNVWLSQGYLFKQYHNYDRLLIRKASYGGKYLGAPNESKITALEEYHYYEPGEKIPLYYDSLYVIADSIPGLETDIAVESRSVVDGGFNVNPDFDLSVGLSLPPVFNGSVIPNLADQEKGLYAHVISKVIRYPAFIKKSVSMENGIYQTVENLAFDPNTGKPVKTVNYDGYHYYPPDPPVDPYTGEKLRGYGAIKNHNGSITSYRFPASAKYDRMGQKAMNERFRLQASEDITIRNQFDARLIYMGQDVRRNYFKIEGDVDCELLRKFNPGDRIEVFATDGDTGFDHKFTYQVILAMGNRIYYERIPGINNPFSNILHYWPIHHIEILHSGRTEQLDAETGQWATYGGASIEDQMQDLIKDISFQDSMKELTGLMNDKLTVVGDMKYIDGEVAHNLGIIYPSHMPVEYVGTSGDCTVGDPKHGAVIIKPDPDDDLIEISVFGTGYLEVFPVGTDNGYGYFRFNEKTGKIEYTSAENPCYRFPIDLNWCYDKNIDGLLAAKVQSWDDEWTMEAALNELHFDIDDPQAVASSFKRGERKFRPRSTFSYRADVHTGTDTDHGERIYDSAGIFKSFEPFVWANENWNNQARWLKANTITTYSPYGDPLIEKNILEIPSVVKMGYQQTSPYLVAANADYEECQFESFENNYNVHASQWEFEDRWRLDKTAGSINTDHYHSGSRSFELSGDEFPPQFIPGGFIPGYLAGTLALKPIGITDHLKEAGLTIQCWVKVAFSDKKDAGLEKKTSVHVVKPDGKVMDVAEKIAQTGEWCLYKAYVNLQPGSYKVGEYIEPSLLIKIPSADGAGGSKEPIAKVMVDDILVKPFDAKVNAFVYDPANLRLITQFDDQLFGTHYQYNLEGKLLRVVSETEQGFKTVEERHVNLPKIPRDGGMADQEPSGN